MSSCKTIRYKQSWRLGREQSWEDAKKRGGHVLPSNPDTTCVYFQFPQCGRQNVADEGTVTWRVEPDHREQALKTGATELPPHTGSSTMFIKEVDLRIQKLFSTVLHLETLSENGYECQYLSLEWLHLRCSLQVTCRCSHYTYVTMTPIACNTSTAITAGAVTRSSSYDRRLYVRVSNYNCKQLWDD